MTNITCTLPEKCPNTEFFLVRIFLYSGTFHVFGLNTEIYSANLPYSVRIQENTDLKKSVFGHFSYSGRFIMLPYHHDTIKSYLIVCTHSFCWGEGVEPPTKFSKKGGGGVVHRILIFRGGCWEIGVTFFRGVACSFYIKNKLKSEIFKDNKI